MYRALDFGRLLRMNVLDTRSYRNDQLCERPGQANCRVEDEPDSTMLGAEQEAWLGRSLSTDSRWNLIAQQVWIMPHLEMAAEGGRQLRTTATDTWNGYAAARGRLVKSIADLGLTNVIVATGDAHIHAAGTVPMRDDEPEGVMAATEFLATSISSGGDMALELPESQRRVLAASPHIDLINRQRGYQTFDIRPDEWRTDLKVLDRVQAPTGQLSLLRRYAVTPDAPLLHRL